MAKRLRVRMLKILQSCCSKDPSSLPSNPVPSFLRLHHSSLRRHVSSALTSDHPKFLWEEEDKYWHVVANPDDHDSPRRKIDKEDDVVPALPSYKMKRRRVRKKKTARRRRSLQSDDVVSEMGRLKTILEVESDKVGSSVAVVKRSVEPLEDFKRSMREMIEDKDMYEEEDLEQLLHCFLSLNSRDHRWLIVQAFTEIWEAMFCNSKVSCS